MGLWHPNAGLIGSTHWLWFFGKIRANPFKFNADLWRFSSIFYLKPFQGWMGNLQELPCALEHQCSCNEEELHMIYIGMFPEEANRTREHPTTSTVLQSFVNCKNTCKDLQKKFMGQHVNLNMVLPLLHASAAVPCKPLPQEMLRLKNHVEIFSAWQDSLGSAKYV